jgi:hypothetical protein
VIKGLGDRKGRFVLENGTSAVSFNNVVLELDDNYTVTMGDWLFHGAQSRVITGTKILTFDLSGTLSVDAVSLIYDPLTNPDDHNIQPAAADGIHYVALRNGLVRVLTASDQASGLTFDLASNTLLHSDEAYGGKKLIFRGNFSSTVAVDGAGFTINLAAVSSSIIEVAAGKTATLTNVRLRDFRPEHVTLGVGSTLTFGPGTTLEFAQDCTLNSELLFTGAVRVDGKGKTITLGASGGLVIATGCTCDLQNAIIAGVSGTKIRSLGASGQFNLNNVTFALSGQYNFTTGLINVQNDFRLIGDTQIMNFQAPYDLTIAKNSRLFVDKGMTFKYDATDAMGDHLVFTDQSSQLFLNGATLYSTTTGVDLTAGTLIIEDACTLKSDATVNIEAMRIMADMNVQLLAGATLEIDGRVMYD